MIPLDEVWREMADFRHEPHKPPEIAGREFETMLMIRDRRRGIGCLVELAKEFSATRA